MPRFAGPIGFATTVQTRPDVWETKTVEHMYTGDVLRNFNRSNNTSGVNDQLSIGNTISVIYRYQPGREINEIQYVHWQGTNWTVTGRELVDNRLHLSLGGVWNGDRVQ